jgi:hypothetical protein
VIQRRPNTFAQTILSFSFFACDKAADHTFRFARDTGQILKSRGCACQVQTLTAGRAALDAAFADAISAYLILFNLTSHTRVLTSSPRSHMF